MPDTLHTVREYKRLRGPPALLRCSHNNRVVRIKYCLDLEGIRKRGAIFWRAHWVLSVLFFGYCMLVARPGSMIQIPYTRDVGVNYPFTSISAV